VHIYLHTYEERGRRYEGGGVGKDRGVWRRKRRSRWLPLKSAWEDAMGIQYMYM